MAARARGGLDRLTAWPGFPTSVARLFGVWAVAALVAAGRFERALLVGIFVTQVFAFVSSQFGAVFGLAVNLALLWLLRAVQAPRGLVVH